MKSPGTNICACCVHFCVFLQSIVAITVNYSAMRHHIGRCLTDRVVPETERAAVGDCNNVIVSGAAVANEQYGV